MFCAEGWVGNLFLRECNNQTKISFVQRPFQIKVRDSSYELFRPEIIEYNLTTRDGTFTAHINLLKDLARPFVDFEVVHDSGNGNFDLVYANKSIDVCMFLRQRKLNILVEIVYKVLSDYDADLPKRCPIRRVSEVSINYLFIRLYPILETL